MDDYMYDMYEWMANIRWADLRRTAGEVALGRSLGQPAAFDEMPWWLGSGRVTDGERRPRRGLCQTLARAAVLWVWGMGATLAWGHGGHPHAPTVTERGAAPTTPTAPTTRVQLEARSARFDFDPPGPGTYRLPVVKPAADGSVLDAAGAARRLRDVLAGRITVLSFVYTRCSDPNGCPLATAVLYQLHGATAGDRELARHLRLVTLSFDPGHDTPETMARYSRVAATQETRSPWEFLTTASDRQLAPILAAYGQVVQRATDPSTPGPSHLLRVYLIDRQLRVRNIYGLDFLDPRLLLADVRTLLLEERQARR
jgi:cytochrome oxidase Cu insertion factor (SCO1/SenC/PrrC family)